MVASFLPLAAGVSVGVAALGLFAQAVTATASRWWAGRRGDRHGHAKLLIPGLLIATAGMTSLIWVSAPAVVIAGMCLFGIGFGITQNATFALMIDRAPASGYGTASALWNLAYDAGYGAGPMVFGVFVAHTGYPAAFALTGLLILIALLPAVRDRAAAESASSGGATSVSSTWFLPRHPVKLAIDGTRRQFSNGVDKYVIHCRPQLLAGLSACTSSMSSKIIP